MFWVHRHTGMCCSNGSLFRKKSLNMGPIFYKNIPKHEYTARLVYACGRDRCSAELLRHWLPVKERLNQSHVACVLHFRQSPAYQNLVSLYNHPESARSRRRLRSSSDVTKLNTVRSFKKAGDSCFCVFGPRLWNKLPVYVREATTVSAFKRLLKTYLFPSIVNSTSSVQNSNVHYWFYIIHVWFTCTVLTLSGV